MQLSWRWREFWWPVAYALKWLVLVGPVAAAIGTACALFLWSLERVTHIRFDQPWLLFLLPFAGAGVSVLYSRFGGDSERGANLLMDAIHGRRQGARSIAVPRRMAPFILLATVVTHLFGGSAGREGTAVQMGGSIASAFGRLFRLRQSEIRLLLIAGIAAGFSGVFGTPLAGTVFALEVLVLGRMKYDALIPCIIAALIADWVCRAWGISHLNEVVPLSPLPPTTAAFDWWLMSKVAVAGIAFGLASILFAEMTHGVQRFFKRIIKRQCLRPFVGGLIIIALVYLLGTRDYLGLSVSSSDPNAVTLATAFSPHGADAMSWFWKLLFTAITLGSGFKGGEVTPLFFIGATLGNVLAAVMNAPVDIFAALGFVAVFAGATNTPLACTIMGMELFGAEYAVYFAAASFISYICSGHSGIYPSQRIGTPKWGRAPENKGKIAKNS
jgi:H+/Cl- antiporter ClcA